VNAGTLVAFEGLDGCGKTTQLRALVRDLRAAGHEVAATREPTDGPSGRRIREIARSGEPVSAQEELRLFFEDRRSHVREVIAPALAAGRVVVTDRYFLSTVAYQGARGLDWEEILRRSEAEFPVPDLVLLLDVTPRTGLARVRARGAALDAAFEEPARLARVAEILRAVDRPYVCRIDAGRSETEVAASVRAAVAERLGLDGGEDGLHQDR